MTDTTLLLTDYAVDGDTTSMEGSVETIHKLERWTRGKSVDRQCALIYHYFRNGGLLNIIVSGILNHLMVLVVTFLACTFVFCFDYKQLTAMIKHMHDPCPGTNPPAVEEPNIFGQDCHGHVAFDITALLRLHLAVYIILAIFALFWLWYFVSFLRSLKDAYSTKRFFDEVLEIDSVTLQTIPWSKLLSRILDIQHQHRFLPSRQGEPYTPWLFTSVMMRKENYFIGLYAEALRPRIPIPGISDGMLMLTNALHWNIDVILRNVIFISTHQLSPQVMSANGAERQAIAKRLRFMFKVFAIGNLLLSPLAFMYRVARFCFSYSDLLRSSPSVLAARQWTLFGRWKLRKYNELEHYLENRLARAYKPASRYVNMFRSHIVVTISRFILFVLGAVFLLLLLLGVVFDEDFFELDFSPNRSVAWWLGMLTVILGLARSQLPQMDEMFEPRLAFNAVQRSIDFVPDNWKQSPEHLDTLAEFSELFPFRIVVVLSELLSVLTTPIMLFFVLPNQAEDIVHFFYEHTYRHPLEGLGDICSYTGPNVEESLIEEDPTVAKSRLDFSVYTFKSQIENESEL